jgi:hypothetical protein
LYDYNTIDVKDVVKFVIQGIIPPFPLTVLTDCGNAFGKAQKLEITSEKLLKRLQKSAPPKDAADTSRNFSTLQVNYANQKNNPPDSIFTSYFLVK